MQTGQYRAAAGLASGESSTSSGASIRAEAEVQQPASSQPGHRSSPNYSFLQALNTGPGIGDSRREKEDTENEEEEDEEEGNGEAEGEGEGQGEG